MTNGQKMGAFIVATFVVGVLLFIGLLKLLEYDTKKVAAMSAEPRVVTGKEVIGQVVGGPQIVTGSPLIGYAVYIEASKNWSALHAEQCPPLGSGQRVVMHQKGGASVWYTFLRFAK